MKFNQLLGRTSNVIALNILALEQRLGFEVKGTAKYSKIETALFEAYDNLNGTSKVAFKLLRDQQSESTNWESELAAY
jgi:hypothetical protein